MELVIAIVVAAVLLIGFVVAAEIDGAEPEGPPRELIYGSPDATLTCLHCGATTTDIDPCRDCFQGREQAEDKGLEDEFSFMSRLEQALEEFVHAHETLTSRSARRRINSASKLTQDGGQSSVNNAMEAVMSGQRLISDALDEHRAVAGIKDTDDSRTVERILLEAFEVDDSFRADVTVRGHYDQMMRELGRAFDAIDEAQRIIADSVLGSSSSSRPQ